MSASSLALEQRLSMTWWIERPRGVIWAASIGVYHCRDMAGACSCDCTSVCVCWSLPVVVGLGKGGEDMEPCKHAVTYVVMIKLSDKGR